MENRPARRFDLAALVAATAVACLAVNAWKHRFFFHDDAFISLRYARNLIDHGELVWNPGERVEGYTNFLHVLLVAGLGRLGLDLADAARSVNLVAAIGLIITLVHAARIVVPGDSGRLARAVALALLIGPPPLAIWVLGGLEAVPVAALVLAGHVPLLRLMEGHEPRPVQAAALAGGVLAAAILMRPDAALFVASSVGVVLLGAKQSLRQRLGAVAALGGIPAAVAVLHALWRFSYYGAWLPNTFHAKAGVPIELRLEGGLSYLALFTIQPPAWGIVIALALATALRGPGRRATALLAAGIGAYALYVVWAGGDHMPAFRLMVPILPLAALAVAAAIARVQSSRTVRVAPVLGVALPALAAFAWPALPMDAAAFVGSLVGQHIGQAWGKGKLVALNTAGSTPYFAPDLRYIDMLGLTEPDIARRVVTQARLPRQLLPGHAKGDGQHVIARRPDYIILGPAHGTPSTQPWFLSDLELHESAEFHRCYRRETAAIHYSEDAARRGPRRPWPLVLTYYARICD